MVAFVTVNEAQRQVWTAWSREVIASNSVFYNTTSGTADTTWDQWTNSTTTATTTSSNCFVWGSWCDNTTGRTATEVQTIQRSVTLGTDVVWDTWCNEPRMVINPGPAPRTPAQPTTKRRINQIRAKRRARDLLRSILTEEQWTDWERYQSVQIEVPSGARYEVVDGLAYLLQGELAVKKFCWHGVGQYNLEDRIAAFILKLRTDEETFLRQTHHNSWREHEQERVRLRRHRRAG